jgi:hypothetical protein
MLNQGEDDLMPLTDAFFSYYAERGYELYALPTFSPATAPEWDAVQRYVYLECGQEKLTTERFAFLMEVLLPEVAFPDYSFRSEDALEILFNANGALAYKDGVYQPTGWDYHGSAVYRPTAISAEGDVFTVYADEIYFGESWDDDANFQVLQGVEPGILLVEGNQATIDADLYTKTLLQIISEAGYADKLQVRTKQIVKFRLSGQDDFPLQYLAHYQGAAVLPSLPSNLRAPETDEIVTPYWAEVQNVDHELNVRNAPALEAEVVGHLYRDSLVVVHAVSGDWVCVSFGVGTDLQYGWVNRQFLSDAG